MNSKTRLALFVIVALVQLAVAGGAIVKSELALRTGDVFRFRVQPVDPVDAFRGRYVAIRFAVDRIPVGDDIELRAGDPVYAAIEVGDDGFANLGEASVDRPADVPYLKLRAGGVYPDDEGKRHLWIALPFARYYMDEESAPEAERAVWSGRRGQREASVTVRIRNGFGVLEELWIDEVPIGEWLRTHADGE